MNDIVNHPSHYTQGNIECIDYILDKKMSYLEGNIIKYVTRYKEKNGIEDLFKAQWYIQRLIDEQPVTATEIKMLREFNPVAPLIPDICVCQLDGRNCGCDHPERGICGSWSEDCATPFDIEGNLYPTSIEELERTAHDRMVEEAVSIIEEYANSVSSKREYRDAPVPYSGPVSPSTGRPTVKVEVDDDPYCLGDFRRLDFFSKPWINE